MITTTKAPSTIYGNVIHDYYSVKGPELINMYVGQSEQNIREGKFCYM